MTDRDLMEQALNELLRLAGGMHGYLSEQQRHPVITALRARLAQPEPYDQTDLMLCDKCGWKAVVPDEGCLNCARKQPAAEPVAWRYRFGDEWTSSLPYWDDKREPDERQPLYAAPQPAADPSGLTAQEAMRLIDTVKYLRGIAERGEGRAMRDDETVEQFVLGYVKRLEQPAAEPVAWMYDVYNELGVPVRNLFSAEYDADFEEEIGCHNVRPLYTAPQPARDIKAALRERNT